MKRDHRTMWQHSNKLSQPFFLPQDLYLCLLLMFCGSENQKARGLHGFYFTQFLLSLFYFPYPSLYLYFATLARMYGTIRIWGFCVFLLTQFSIKALMEPS
jgi:hypothetical protein